MPTWARDNRFLLTPDAPEVLDFYGHRSQIFMAARFDASRAAELGQAAGDGTPIMLTIPTDAPWVPRRILSLGLDGSRLVEADVFLELVVGDSEVHRRHANGSERRHPPVPGEVSIAPGDTAMTFYEFTEVGSIVYACHLPGHVAYGMEGTIEVVPAT